MTFISALFSVFVVILTIQFHKNLCLDLGFCVLGTVEDGSVMVLEGLL
jgi:hypothetical protein